MPSDRVHPARRRWTSATLLVVQAVLLAGCLQFEPYGNPTGLELEPLADGWTPNLAFRGPSSTDRLRDQYRWRSASGVLVSMGSDGFNGERQLQVELWNEGTSPVDLSLLSDGGGSEVWDISRGWGRDVRLRVGESDRLEPGRYRKFSIRCVPWLDEPKVGDQIALEFGMKCGETEEVCPCAFAVNHLFRVYWVQ